MIERVGMGIVVMTVSYDNWVVNNWGGLCPKDGDDLRQLFIMTTGLAGESGEVLELLKKAVRGRQPVDVENLKLELGDVLYYLTMLANRHGFTLADVIRANVQKLEARRAARDAEAPQP